MSIHYLYVFPDPLNQGGGFLRKIDTSLLSAYLKRGKPDNWGNDMKKILTVLLTCLFVFFFLVIEIQANDSTKGFSLKFTGGYGTMSIGDLNVLPNATKEGAFKKPNTGFEYEGELIISLSEHFGIGIGAGYIWREEPSESTFEEDFGSYYLQSDNSYSPELSAIPIKLSVYYYFPILSRMNLFLNGGIGYYFGKLNYHRLVDSHHVFEDLDSQDVKEDSVMETKDNGMGFHGGIGLEYDFMKNLTLFIEGAGRYIQLKGWEGDIIRYVESTYDDGTTEGATETSYGTLWYYEYYPETHPDWPSYVLKIQEEKPMHSEFRNVRKAEGDLSGLSVRIGFRIKF
jgi:opacity protein-like surface antigen